jgi:epoxyqueuosine reductase QueG
MERARNFGRLTAFLNSKFAETGYNGIVGVAGFRAVYDELMPIQKSTLEGICSGDFQGLLKDGSMICIGLAYPEHAIDCIDVRMENGAVDKHAWNIYAREYHKLNSLLNDFSRDVADRFEGIAIPATVERVAVKNVEDYYGMTVSHRVVAENAGLGWRGKNELVVNDRFSCALRFASVVTSLPLTQGRKTESLCGGCEACLEACSFLKNKNRLENYRESCREYIVRLGLESEVCGKCIKACYRRNTFSNRFKLE